LSIFRVNCYFQGNFFRAPSKMPSRTPMRRRVYTPALTVGTLDVGECRQYNSTNQNSS